MNRSRSRSNRRTRRTRRSRGIKSRKLRSSKRSKKGGWGATATKDNKPLFPSLLSGGWGGAPELGF